MLFSCRGVAQSGSASALGAEGREFESHRPDQFYPSCPDNHVAEPDRAIAFQAVS